MRGRLLNMPAIGRAVGFALVAIAIVAAALHFRTSESHVRGLNVSPAVASDPLTAELQRCQALATQANDDAGCDRENAGDAVRSWADLHRDNVEAARQVLQDIEAAGDWTFAKLTIVESALASLG